MKKYILAILLLFTFFAFPQHSYCACTDGTCYAAPTPTGSGTDCTTGSPCTVSYALNTKMADGDDLVLKDGTYDNALDMIAPPSTLDGTSGDHVSIIAENDGEVLIDGGGTLTPVKLNGNDYFDLEGFNAANAGTENNGRVIWVYNSSHVTVKRIVAWDAHPDYNGMPFNISAPNLDDASDVLVEDCAGWGTGRKIFQIYKMDDVTFRRCFFRWVGQNDQNPFVMGLTFGYQSTNVLVENCIGTWDETSRENTGLIKDAVFGADLTYAGGGYGLYGNIAYVLQNQQGSLPRLFSARQAGVNAASAIIWENNIAYTDRNDIMPLETPNSTQTINYFTAVGGTYPGFQHSAVRVDNQTGTANYFIQMNSNEDGVHENGNDFDYVWFYNNAGDDYAGVAPAHYTTGSDPDLIGKCGNILQYNCTDNRPEVSGQDVGAKIQYRYVDGVLTEDDLWPWPMEDRIADALVDSGYDTAGLDGNGATGLTEVVFGLGGGSYDPIGEATGTIIPGGCTEAEIVAGGKTIVITLTNSIWESDIGTDCANTTALIAGFDSDEDEAGGWNAKIRDDDMDHTWITRDSDTQVTVDLAAVADYQITANETITVTIPDAAVTTDGEIVATPSFQISATLSAPTNLSIVHSDDGSSIVFDSDGVDIVN